jgi:DNA primase
MQLPAGYDPDRYITEYKTLSRLQDKAEDIFIFYIQQKGADFADKSTQEKIETTRDFITTILTIKDPLKQDMLLQKASSVFSIPFQSLKKELYQSDKKQTMRRKSSTQDEKDPHTKSPGLVESISQLEQTLLSTLLKGNMDILDEDDKTLLYYFVSKPLKHMLQKIYDNIDDIRDKKGISSIFSQEEQRFLSYIMIQSEQSLSDDHIHHVLKQFYKKRWKALVHRVKIRIAEAAKNNDSQHISHIITHFEKLKKKMLDKGLI